jgi:hypothetical protein
MENDEYKINLIFYQHDEKVKNYRLSNEQCTVGRSQMRCDIVINELSKESFLIKIKNKGEKVYIAPLEDKLKLNGQRIKEKKKLEHEDEIKIKNVKGVKFIFECIKKEGKKNSIKEQDSSNTTQVQAVKKESQNDIQKSTEKQNGHIKSEIIWKAVEFDNDKKKDKFLRLLGAKKSKNTEPDTFADEKLTKDLTKSFKKIEEDLTKQFYQTTGGGIRNHYGVGN